MIPFLLFHKSKVLLFSLCVIFISTAQKVSAQVSFSVVCPQKEIGKNDVLQISFKVENASNVESIIPPDFKHFVIVGGPNQQSGMTSINGKIDQYVSVGFDLKPKSTGTFVIGSATATADGKTFSTRPVEITVTNQSSVSPNNNQQNQLSPFSNFGFDFPSPPARQFDDYILKPGENAEEKVKKDLALDLEVNKKTVYVGEPIVASYKLYTRLRSETTISDAPAFNGFSVSDLEVKNNDYNIEEYNGRKYNVYTLRKVQLYPLQAGTFTLDPLVSNNKVTFLKAEFANRQNTSGFYDLLEDFSQSLTPQNEMVEKDVTLKSKPVTIIVKPLPTENKPTDFKGAVGYFSLNASLEKNNLTTDDAGNLVVTLSGKGNIQMVNAPKITWPQGLEGYDPKVKDNVDNSSVPMKGTKTFTFPFTISDPGIYTIDSIEFSYFDPELQSYKTLRTPPLTVSVKKGTGNSNNEYVKAAQKNKDEPFYTNKKLDIVIGISLCLLIILLIFFAKNKKQNRESVLETHVKVDDIENDTEEETQELKIPQNPLAEAHDKLKEDDSVGFYHTIHYSLKKYLCLKFKIQQEEFSRKRVNEELDKCNVGIGTSHLLNSVLDEIEINLYAPAIGSNEQKDIFEKASEVVSLLDKQC